MESNAALPPKPKYTEPCNHCGQCCKEQLCDIARMIFPGAQAPCPAIQIRGGKALCGAVLAELSAGMKPVIQNSLGIGTGCSMPDAETTWAQIDEFNLVSHIKIFGQSAECAQ